MDFLATLFSGFQWIDWAIIVVIAVSALYSLKEGFVREAISLLTWFVAVMVSIVFHEQLAIFLQDSIASPSMRQVVAIVMLFIASMIVGNIVSYLATQAVEMTGLDTMDRLLGLVFGALRGVIIIVFAVIVGEKILPLYEEIWWKKSVLLPHVLRMESSVMMLGSAVSEKVMPFLNGLF